ncbi:response regulator [Brevibacillus sp. SYSU BS000544]|uniref:response regulator n=1 Tax=Brevibacillus sp. SYSU BS000544 TaxID=3416443 RepID=UPI003CE4E4CA
MQGEAVTSKISVLIVEDDHRIAEINRRFVEKVRGFEVVGIATDQTQVKEQLEILQPDLVLLDIYFPDMNGLELLRFIQQEHRSCDVIMITAGKEVEKVTEAIRGGAFDYIVKPVIFARFEATLERYRDFYWSIKRLKQEGHQIDQDEIDQLLQVNSRKGAKECYLPKGIDPLTLDKVEVVLKQESTGITVEKISKEMGISRSTARRYLEFLVTKGEATADISYGAVGRPERVYLSKEKM